MLLFIFDHSFGPFILLYSQFILKKNQTILITSHIFVLKIDVFIF